MSGGLGYERVDVVVVGGGMAALQAAIAAAEVGAEVALLTRRKMGRSGSSAMTTGGYAAVMEDSEEDHRDIHFEDTMVGGGGIADPELVRILCDEGPPAVAELERIGGAFSKREGRYALSGSGDHTRHRSLGAAGHIGTDFTGPQAERAAQLGVRAIEFYTATEVLVNDGKAAGVLAVNTRGGGPLVVDAGATVLATGGCGQLFPVTSNPIEVTGGGYYMAARAGAILRDMEFIQFYPWRCIDPFSTGRVAIQPATFTVGAKMYNSEGHRFMVDYEPQRMEATTRDVSARAIFDQVRQGLGVGGGVRLDLSELGDEELAETNPKLIKLLPRLGIDHRTYPFVVSPEAHYFMGGAVIDTHGATTVERLYAAGEVAGGVQGANRLSNNALPETLVFGARAGRHAAQTAAEGERVEPDPDQLGEALANYDRIQAGRQLTLDRSRIQQLAWRALGIIRHGREMADASSQLETMEAELVDTGTGSPERSEAWWDLRFMVEVGRLAMTAALARQESRGAHHREDFPQRDDDRWLGAVTVQRTGDRHLTGFVAAPQLQASSGSG